jgi:hypothetical protein
MILILLLTNKRDSELPNLFHFLISHNATTSVDIGNRKSKSIYITTVPHSAHDSSKK